MTALVNSLTYDSLLGGAVKIWQPGEGYRISVDTLLLASCPKLKPSSLIIDMGCGVGGVSLCLSHRQRDVPHMIKAIDIQKELTDLCQKNITENGLDHLIEVSQGHIHDFAQLHGKADIVVANPPYFKVDDNSLSPHATKRTANHELTGDLAAWVKQSVKFLKNKGVFWIIYPTDRLADLMSELNLYYGRITIYPIWARAEENAKRVIISAQKSVQAPSVLSQGLVLHGKGQEYTKQAQKIMQGGGFFA